MKLHAVNRQFPVNQAHDFTFGGFGRDFQAGWQRVAFDDKGVVAGRLERAGQAGPPLTPFGPVKDYDEDLAELLDRS